MGKENSFREAPAIHVAGARDQNLKGVDLELKHGAWTAIVGPSGSGKSTLVFQTLVREGERRYLGALSAKARQFFGKLGRSQVRSLRGLPVPIAVGQRSITSNPRSTVGTQSGVLDVLRLLFARAAEAPGGESLTRSHFSFNATLGACDACSGTGLEDRVEPSLLVADGSQSIRDGALVPTLKNGYTVYSQVTLDVMDQIAYAHGFDVDTPWDSLTEGQRGVVLYGTKALTVPFGKHSLESRMKWEGITARPREEGYYRGLIPVIEETLKRSRNDNILRFVESVACSECAGTRLGRLGRCARMGETTLPALLSVPIAAFGEALAALPRGPVLVALEETLVARVERMAKLGLGHLTLDRGAATLSAGEAKRLRLAAHLTGGLSGALYALDEPTLGLHPESRAGMRDLLDDLVAQGNTLAVVEHDPDMVRCADHVVALGPGAGPHGGEIVAQGPGESWVLGQVQGEARPSTREPFGSISLRGATLHNLNDAELRVDLGVFNVVIGPSGAGKTSLVLGTLLPGLRGERGGSYKDLDVPQGVRVQAVDARPMGRSSRSTPATWSGAFDGIRKAFAATAGAQAVGLSASDFSFNAKGGRCGECEGIGSVRVGLHLLEDAVQICGVCSGTRYDARVLEATLGGLTVAQVLALSIDKAAEFFVGLDAATTVTAPLVAMVELGIGYLRLGAPSTQLSSGEAQRIRLATLLSKERMEPSLFVFDEPDRGLDPVDIQRLLRAFHGLCERGHTVLAISHHRHLWQAANTLTEVRGGVAGRTSWDAVCETAMLAPRAARARRVTAELGSIRVRGARTHNLQGVDVDVQHGVLTAITGVSGSGKSSLAFDTIAAEAMHRYAEALPFQVRRYMTQLPRPSVDSIDGLTPTIVLRQAATHGAGPSDRRSTLATQSEIGPLVRLLFARAGKIDGAPAELTQSHFSPDRPIGSCPACAGRGESLRATVHGLVSDPTLSLSGGALGGSKAGAFFTEGDGQHLATLRIAAGQGLDAPWEDLPERVREVAMRGTGDVEYDVEWSFRRGKREGTHQFVGPWEGFLALVEKEARRRGATKSGKAWLDVLEPSRCPECDGVGLGSVPRSVRIGELSIAEAWDVPVVRLVDTLAAHAMETGAQSESHHGAWGELAIEISERASALVSLGLGNATLGARASDMSVSELQRVRLASVLFSGLSGATVVLDEPGAGLTDEDLSGLVEHLQRLTAEGNTVIAVTHRAQLIAAAAHVIRLGPGAGSAGGTVLTHGEGRTVDPAPNADDLSDAAAAHAQPIKGATERVALADDLNVPVSGLVVLEGALHSLRSAFGSALASNDWDYVVDARRGIQATMPLTAFGKMTDLQKLFHGVAADVDLPRAAFSFMSPKGRCPRCSGSGVDRVALDFMADLAVPCEACGGERYRPEVLAVTWGGMNVAQFLATPVADLKRGEPALPPGLERVCEALVEVGLGHLALGRRTATLSGGEAQRLGLAVGLASATSAAGPTLCLLEHPGSGLSKQDLIRLIETLRRHAARGVLFLAAAHRAELLQAASERLMLLR